MIRLSTTILSNKYLLRRCLKSANKKSLSTVLSIAIISTLYLQFVFFHLYLKEVLQVISTETEGNNLQDLQFSLSGDRLMVMQFSLWKDIFGFLAILVGIYFFFHFRNKLSILRLTNQQDSQTKLFLGVHPKYIARELLIKNLIIYSEGYIASYLFSLMLDSKLANRFNQFLPYKVSAAGKRAIFTSQFLAILILILMLVLFSKILAATIVNKSKRNYSFDC